MMSDAKTVIDAVQSAWDERGRWRDEWLRRLSNGWPRGLDRWQRPFSISICIALLIVTACLLNALSELHDFARQGRQARIWEPLLWELTSAAMLIALLPLPRRGAKMAAQFMGHPWRVGFLVLLMALLFSTAHICGMVALRTAAEKAMGATYAFSWSVSELTYELRKDLFSFSLIAMLFWLCERAFAAALPTQVGEPSAPVSVTGSGAAGPDTAVDRIWLRDGKTNVRVKVEDIVCVRSAGNYVEHRMADGRCHLIRATLREEEARLSKFDIRRVHRTRLVNVRRITTVSWRSTGDFDLQLDNGETVVGSRRFKDSVSDFRSVVERDT